MAVELANIFELFFALTSYNCIHIIKIFLTSNIFTIVVINVYNDCILVVTKGGSKLERANEQFYILSMSNFTSCQLGQLTFLHPRAACTALHPPARGVEGCIYHIYIIYIFIYIIYICDIYTPPPPRGLYTPPPPRGGWRNVN